MAATASFDTIIVGQGLAGTTLAWHLLQAGQSVLVIDRGEDVTSSKIAAGLMTPITGLRLGLSATFEREFAYAARYYRQIENITGARFFNDRTAIRYLRDDREYAYWRKRKQDSACQPFLLETRPEDHINPKFLKRSEHGFTMRANIIHRFKS